MVLDYITTKDELYDLYAKYHISTTCDKINFLKNEMGLKGLIKLQEIAQNELTVLENLAVSHLWKNSIIQEVV